MSRPASRRTRSGHRIRTNSRRVVAQVDRGQIVRRNRRDSAYTNSLGRPEAAHFAAFGSSRFLHPRRGHSSYVNWVIHTNETGLSNRRPATGLVSNGLPSPPTGERQGRGVVERRTRARRPIRLPERVIDEVPAGNRGGVLADEIRIRRMRTVVRRRRRMRPRREDGTVGAFADAGPNGQSFRPESIWAKRANCELVSRTIRPT